VEPPGNDNAPKWCVSQLTAGRSICALLVGSPPAQAARQKKAQASPGFDLATG